MAKILVVEDDRKLCQSIEKWLAYERHLVEVVEDGEKALENLRFYKYDLVILDWALPGMTGMQVLREFRAAGGTTLILMLTGKKSLQEKEEGLDAGADDYLTKPFHVRELSARIKALLRRSPAEADDEISSGDLVLYPSSYRAVLAGEEIRLSPQEFLILRLLMKNPTTIFSHEALISYLRDSDPGASYDTVRTRIKILRKKLDKPGVPSWIRTIHGQGYQLDAPS